MGTAGPRRRRATRPEKPAAARSTKTTMVAGRISRFAARSESGPRLVYARSPKLASDMVLADRRDYLPFTPDGKDPPRARAPAVPASQTIRGATAAAPLRARSSAAAIILCSDRQAHSRFAGRL